MDKLVELACEVLKILKSIDTSNRVVSPEAFTGGKDHIDHLDHFLASGGKSVLTVAHHFYVTQSGPEAIVPIIGEVRRVMAKNGVGEKASMENTETGWRFDNKDSSADHPMVRSFGGRRELCAQSIRIVES